MGKQNTSSIIETETGEVVGNKSLAMIAIKAVPDFIEDIIDELKVDKEREVIQRYICEPPLYDKEPNSVNYIAQVTNMSRFHVNRIIKNFKELVWRHMNGKNIGNN